MKNRKPGLVESGLRSSRHPDIVEARCPFCGHDKAFLRPSPLFPLHSLCCSRCKTRSSILR